MHFYAWQSGLKTGMYYLRTQAVAQAVQFTIEKQASNDIEPVIPTIEQSTAQNDLDDITTDFTAPSCRMEEGCVTCSS